MLFKKNLLLCCFFITLIGQAQAGEITISVATSLANAMDEIQVIFSNKYPSIAIHTNYAASTPLLQQIREGAPVDVFVSADQPTMDKAAKEELIVPESRRDFTANGLVLIVPQGAANNAVQTVDDLHKATRVAVGNPETVPAGRYAREALQSVNLWDAITPALIYGESVRQVLDYVAREEVDAGVVYATDAALFTNKVRVAAVLQGHSPITYPVAVVKHASNPIDAQLFVDFIFSDEAQNILQQYGFTRHFP